MRSGDLQIIIDIFYIQNIHYSANIYIRIMGVPIMCPVGIDNILFRSRAGEAEEAWRYVEDITKSSG